MPAITYEGCSLGLIKETYPVIVPDDYKEKELLLIDVIGDSMQPQTMSGVKVLAFHIPTNDIKYESGTLYAIMYANRFMIKHIKTNELSINSILLLHSDNERFCVGC